MIKSMKLLGLIVVVCLVALIAWAKYENWKMLHTPLEEYASIALGASRAEVRYAKGIPAIVYDPQQSTAEGRSTFDADNLPDGKSLNDYSSWIYWLTSPRSNTGENVQRAFLKVEFKDDAVFTLHCMAPHDENFVCPALPGDIGIQSSEDDVRKALGAPDREKLDEENGIKRLYYDGIGAVVMLTKRRVDAMMVYGAKEQSD